MAGIPRKDFFKDAILNAQDLQQVIESTITVYELPDEMVVTCSKPWGSEDVKRFIFALLRQNGYYAPHEQPIVKEDFLGHVLVLKRPGNLSK